MVVGLVGCAGGKGQPQAKGASTSTSPAPVNSAGPADSTLVSPVVPSAAPTATYRKAPSGLALVTGHSTLSGGLNDTRDGTVQFIGGGAGPSCEGQARTFTGLSYFYPSAGASSFRRMDAAMAIRGRTWVNRA